MRFEGSGFEGLLTLGWERGNGLLGLLKGLSCGCDGDFFWDPFSLAELGRRELSG